jgi:hypothetical protein
MHYYEILRLTVDSMVRCGLSDSTIDSVTTETMESVVKEELARVEHRIRRNANQMLESLSRTNRNNYWTDRPIPSEPIKREDIGLRRKSVKVSDIKPDPASNVRSISPHYDTMQENEYTGR